MSISRDLAIQILKYLDRHPDFYFPFRVMCKEYSDEDDDFVEIEPAEWKLMQSDPKYQTFELWENLQNFFEETIRLMSEGFIRKITNHSLETHIRALAKNYRSECKKGLLESGNMEAICLNEFLCGKAEAYADCLELIRMYRK